MRKFYRLIFKDSRHGIFYGLPFDPNIKCEDDEIDLINKFNDLKDPYLPYGNFTSFFTEEGYRHFKDAIDNMIAFCAREICCIQVTEGKLGGPIIYEDEYQIMVGL